MVVHVKQLASMNAFDKYENAAVPDASPSMVVEVLCSRVTAGRSSATASQEGMGLTYECARNRIDTFVEAVLQSLLAAMILGVA